MDSIRPLLPAGCLPSGKAVAATVEGDVHDFGKNVIVSMLVGYGADVTDLGVDMPAEDIADVVESTDTIVVLLSASLTSTLASLKEAVEAVRARCPDAVVMVGGPVVTPVFSGAIGADVFTSDAASAARIARDRLMGRRC